MLLGYNTSGLADHDLLGAIQLVADLGYQSVAITLDHHRLNPYDDRLQHQLDKVQELLAATKLEVVVETGGRYLLDNRRKHQPTLISSDEAGRQRRIDFLKRAIDIADVLQASCVSFWSGTGASGDSYDHLEATLVKSLVPVIDHAGETGVPLAFEPEPGHLIDRLASYESLLSALPQGQADCLRLTMDIGHVHCQNEGPIGQQLRTWNDRLANIHIEDMRRGVHEHLMFGDGEIDFAEVIKGIQAIGYSGPATVELPRHSHQGPIVAQRSYQFLTSLMAQQPSQEA